MADISKIMGIELDVVSPAPYVWIDTFDNGDNWLLQDGYSETRFANSSWEYYAPHANINWITYLDSTRGTTPWQLEGDFEFIVDFNITSIVNDPGGSVQGFAIFIADAAGGKSASRINIYIYGNGTGGLTYYDDVLYTEWGTLTTGAFRFRAVRSGITLKMYAWHNNRWEWNGDTDGLTSEETWDEPVEVMLLWRSASDTSYILGNVDTFTLVSGNRVLI